MAKNRLTLKNLKTFGSVFFGKYPNKTDDAEPIEWQVIKTEDDKALLLSRYLLACRRFDEVTSQWDQCELNEWLNGEFYDAAFSSGDKLKIAPDTETGCNVFILSREQAETFLTQEQRGKYFTPYAAKIADSPLTRLEKWWLRDCFDAEIYPYKCYSVKIVREYYLHEDAFVYLKLGVAPAIWVRTL